MHASHSEAEKDVEEVDAFYVCEHGDWAQQTLATCEAASHEPDCAHIQGATESASLVVELSDLHRAVFVYCVFIEAQARVHVQSTKRFAGACWHMTADAQLTEDKMAPV